jgi:superfamily II DNA or RNA helicase
MDVNSEKFAAYMFVYENDPFKTDKIKDLLYDKLYKYSSVPLIPEWKTYIYNELSNQRVLREARTLLMNGVREVEIYKYVGNVEQIKSIIETGLRSGALNINGSNEPSALLEDISGLNDYLSIFGSLLADKIQNKFRPKFIPGTDNYTRYLRNIDDYIHHKGIELYEAQLATIQSTVNNFDVNKYSIIVGEMGCGKTLQAGSACYVHNANKFKGYNALIMSPSHLVEKWKSEMETYIPNAKGYIVHNLDELLALETKLKAKNRVENMYVIMSKEIAKLGFDQRPAAVWSKSKKCFVCPECGQPIWKEETVKIFGRRTKTKINLTELDFLKQLATNTVCPNKIKVWDKKAHAYKEEKCGAKLWTALNRDDIGHGWIKLGEAGWIREEFIDQETEKLMAKEKLDKKETTLFNKLFDQYEYYQEHGCYNITYKGPKKYPVAQYIYERMNGLFDYLILDEMHQLMSNSLQGHASHLLMKAAKHCLLLTGTLLNGYASNIFYTLFRVCPNVMVQEGFRYEDEMEFARLFGVTSKESTFEVSRGRAGNRVGSAREKELPGVSPLIFTKFLLNITAFIALDQMTEGLPDYEEIPVAIEMDNATASGYNTIKDFFRQRCGGMQGQTKKIMSSMIKLMTQYPDAPHCKRFVTNPDTNEVEFESAPLEKSIRNKEQRLLEIIQEKIACGEKVLVYYNTINTTDLGDHLTAFLLSEDIKAFELKASVKAEKRMEFITKEVNKGAQVMITNPALVETGLDLLDFTTIIFFQIGYNLSTMRQASRRSWRLSQTKDIQVYFFYYTGTIQEQAMALMATKLQAAQTIEGNFSEEGLKAMSNNEDMLTQIANNVVNDIKQVVDMEAFKSSKYVKEQSNTVREHDKTIKQIECNMNEEGQRVVFNVPEVLSDAPQRFIDVTKLKNPIELFL